MSDLPHWLIITLAWIGADCVACLIVVLLVLLATSARLRGDGDD